MRFFLIARDRDSGAVTLVSDRTYDSRSMALAGLEEAVSADSPFADADLFVVDIEAVTPVVVYRPKAGAEPAAAPIVADVPMADAWETPPIEAAGPLLESIEHVAPADGPVAAPVDDLADALRRAASQMKDEGVVPAPTVEEVIAAQVAQVEQDADDAVQPAPDDALVAELEALAAAGVPSEPEPAEDAADPGMPVEEPTEATTDAETVEEQASTEAAWPWEPPDAAATAEEDAPQPTEGPDATATPVAGLDSLTLPAPESQGVREPASEVFRPTGIDEPSIDAGSLLPVPDDEFVPRPVIMGDYADVADEPAPAAPTSLEDLGIPSEWLEEAGAVAAPEPVPAEPDVPEDAEPSPEPVLATEPDSEPIDDVIAAFDVGMPEDPAPVKAYEPASVDMNAYTCDDCVYTGTCPKAGQERPASCGSFQWKSV